MRNLIEQLEAVTGEGHLRFLDLHFARWMGELGVGDPVLVLSAALVSRSLGEGDVCLDLRTCADTLLFPGIGVDLVTPPLTAWRDALRKNGQVGRPGQVAPLILDEGDRLYLGRYWQLEQDLAGGLKARCGQRHQDLDFALLRDGLDRLFPASEEIDWQRVAATLAVVQPLCVISGGPGTGKTRTVTAILALLLEQYGPGLRIAMAAPTGKAAARLTESVLVSRDRLDLDQGVADALPLEASTLHRLLGYRPGRVRPKHGPDNPMHLDVLVVDEASMVDLPLMSRLFRALHPQTRLILLGDKDQLASVEAGMVLGDICGQGDSGGYSPEQCTLIQEVAGISLDPEDGPPIADQVAVLHRSYRFGGDSGIGAAARALNAGDGEAALSVLADKSIGDASIAPVVGEDLKDFLGSWIVERMSSCLSAGDTSAVLAAFNRFRILCAVRGGARGVLEINRLCELRLEEAGLIGRGRGGNYAGRPLMVTTNAYGLGLFNGDVGMLLADTAGDGSLRACFETGDEVRRFPVPRLPAHESVYAMTVHKSQGSEFDEVLLILPDKESRVLSRELLYTGITRARRRVTLLGDPERIREAANRPVVRSSGLYDALWKR